MKHATSLLQIQRLNSLLEYQFIRRDAAGRYNLADIHEMAGRRACDRPSNWTQRVRVNRLIEAFRELYPHAEPLVVVRTGPRTGYGTFTVEELAILYADWISPEHGQRIREAMASGKPLEADEDLKIKANKLFSRALGLEDAANDPIEPMTQQALRRFLLDYVSARRVVAVRDIRDVLMSVTGEEISTDRIGRILPELGCVSKIVGSTRLHVTPLGLESGLSLGSPDNEMTEARQDELDGVRVRLNAAEAA